MVNNAILECQKYLHPEEPTDVTSMDVKKHLEELGWVEGDKIPSGMGDYTTAVLHILGKPLTVKSLPVFFADETVQITLKSALNKTKLYIAENANIDNKVKELVPNVDNLTGETAETVLNLAKEVVKHDIEKEAEMSSDDVDGFEEDTTTEEEIKEVKPEENKHILCPRCMWDVAEPYDPYPVTEEDKLNYLYSLLSGDEFVKSYTVAQGMLEISYKVSSAYLARLIEDRLKLDAINGDVTDYEQSFIMSTRYGLAVSLKSVKALKGIDKNPPIPDILDDKFKTDKGTPDIRKFTEYIEENIIKSGTRENLFRSTYNNFVRLHVHLNRTLESENFSQAVLDSLF